MRARLDAPPPPHWLFVRLVGVAFCPLPKVYIGDLSYDTDVDELRRLGESYGTVQVRRLVGVAIALNVALDRPARRMPLRAHIDVDVVC